MLVDKEKVHGNKGFIWINTRIIVVLGLMGLFAGCAGGGQGISNSALLHGEGAIKCVKLSPDPVWGERKVCGAQHAFGGALLILEGHIVAEGGQGIVVLTAPGEYSFGDIMVSPDETYLALLTASEGHPLLQVISLPELFEGPDNVSALLSIDPYPGGIYVKSWESSKITLAAEFDLTVHPKERTRGPEGAEMLFEADLMTGDLWRIK